MEYVKTKNIETVHNQHETINVEICAQIEELHKNNIHNNLL